MNIGGSFLVGHYAQVFGNKRILIIGTSTIIISAFLLLGLHFINPNNLWFIILPLCLLYGVDGAIYPAAAGKAYGAIKANAGVGAAFYGTILIGGCAVALALAAHLPHTTIVPYALLTLGIGFIITFLLVSLRKEL
jgi:MFS family permease